jgi:hypothetical protein
VKRVAFQAFVEGTTDAEFLCKAEVVEYLKVLRAKSVRSIQVAESLIAGSSEQDVCMKMANEEAELAMWFTSQFVELRDIFRPFMRIRHVVGQ